MKLFEETIKFLKSSEFFTGILDRIFLLLFSAVFFGLLIYVFIYKPVILFYLLVAGMLVMGWFMLYFIFPGAQEWVFSLRRALVQLLSKFKP